MSKYITIVSYVIDAHKLTMYKEDGSSITIPQGDPRVKQLVTHMTPRINATGKAIIKQEWLEEKSILSDFEKGSKTIRFFLAAKQAVKRFFSSDNENSHQEKIDSLIQESKPVESDNINPEFDTVLAVFEDDDGETKAIPNMEKLINHFYHSNKHNSYTGMKVFLKRLAKVQDKRQHTAQELLEFLSTGNLPIADDGQIVFYKTLNKHSEKEGLYVDMYTGKVPQRAGSLVRMDEKLVDPSRREQCSQGLHIATQNYLRSFMGTSVFIGKTAPEDVIAVPAYEPTKMRVSQYHLIQILSDEMKQQISRGEAFTEGSDNLVLLENVLAGKHAAYDQIVTIGGPYGTNITVDELSHVTDVAQKQTKDIPQASRDLVPDVKNKKKTSSTVVRPKDVAKVSSALTRKDRVQVLVKAIQEASTGASRDTAIAHLVQLKKSSKVSWEKLGVADPEKLGILVARKKAPKKPSHKWEPDLPATQTRKQVAQDLYEKMLNTSSTQSKKTYLEVLVLHKKKSKQSWEKLGLDKATMELYINEYMK